MQKFNRYIELTPVGDSIVYYRDEYQRTSCHAKALSVESLLRKFNYELENFVGALINKSEKRLLRNKTLDSNKANRLGTIFRNTKYLHGELIIPLNEISGYRT